MKTGTLMQFIYLLAFLILSCCVSMKIITVKEQIYDEIDCAKHESSVVGETWNDGVNDTLALKQSTQ